MKILDRKVRIDINECLPERISSPEEMLLFDIETTGLKKEYCRIYLIGCAYLDSDGWHIRQYLTQSSADEKEILKSFLSFAQGFKILVTFNGEGFDIPFTGYRAFVFGLDGEIIKSLKSFDIYKKAKPLKKLLGQKSLSQKSVEVFLKIKRDDQLDGGKLIPYYYEYELTASAENERLLLLHNFEDVLGMGEILPILNYLGILEEKFEFFAYAADDKNLTVRYLLEYPLPAAFKNGRISADENVLSISFEIEDESVLFPLKDPENYYFLPLEKTVIHKDLAAFVDKKYRVRATKENCFLRVSTQQIKSLNRDDFKSYAINMLNIYK